VLDTEEVLDTEDDVLDADEDEIEETGSDFLNVLK
jgi:hypothetical protein